MRSRREADQLVGGLAVHWGGRPGWLTGLRLSDASLALLRIP